MCRRGEPGVEVVGDTGREGTDEAERLGLAQTPPYDLFERGDLPFGDGESFLDQLCHGTIVGKQGHADARRSVILRPDDLVRHASRFELPRDEPAWISAQKGHQESLASEHRDRPGDVDYLTRRGNARLVRPVYGTGLQALKAQRSLHRGRPAEAQDHGRTGLNLLAD